jgi:hypothetical protein
MLRFRRKLRPGDFSGAASGTTTDLAVAREPFVQAFFVLGCGSGVVGGALLLLLLLLSLLASRRTGSSLSQSLLREFDRCAALVAFSPPDG